MRSKTMEIPLFRIRVFIFLVIFMNIINEYMTSWVSRAHMVLAPAVLFAFMVEISGLLIGALFGRDMNKLIVVLFDFIALLMFGTLSIVVFAHMDERTFRDPNVMNACMPVVTFFLYLIDMILVCIFFQDELEIEIEREQAERNKRQAAMNL